MAFTTTNIYQAQDIAFRVLEGALRAGSDFPSDTWTQALSRCDESFERSQLMEAWYDFTNSFHMGSPDDSMDVHETINLITEALMAYLHDFPFYGGIDHSQAEEWLTHCLIGYDDGDEQVEWDEEDPESKIERLEELLGLQGDSDSDYDQ